MEFRLYKIRTKVETESETEMPTERVAVYVITPEGTPNPIPFGEFCSQISEAIGQQAEGVEVSVSDIIFALRSRSPK